MDHNSHNTPIQQKLYKQIDGVAMVSPLAPAVADIFMNWLIDEIQKKTNISLTIYHYDDLFLAFDNQMEFDIIFKLNDLIHKNITFSIRIEKNNHFCFLDVNITKAEDNIENTVLKKQTYTGLYTKLDSYISYKHRQNLVLTLLDRAFKIHNYYKLIRKEFQNTFVSLQKNKFPNSFLEKQILNYLNIFRTK